MQINNKSQSAIEFIALAGFMLFVVLGFFAVTSSKILDVKEEANRQIAEDTANFVNGEIEIAKTVNSGYSRFFFLPLTINGVDYTITLTDNRELAVNYLGYEYVRFVNATGTISKGKNKISNVNGRVYMNS